MTSQNNLRLIAMPADIHYHLLNMLPDFADLGAIILTHRCFHDVYKTGQKTLLNDVAQNFLGCLFDQALLLARAQKAAYGLGDLFTKSLSTNTVVLLGNNDYILQSLEQVVFGLLKADSKQFDIYDSESLARFAADPFTAESSWAEFHRFMAAGYRFWEFVLQPRNKRTAFLKNLAPSSLLELNHFVSGISKLIYAISGRTQESDHDWDFVASVLSTGPESILRLWQALQNGDPDFHDELDSVGGGEEEGFFSYSYWGVMESKKLDKIHGLGALKPIFDADNQKMHEMLEEFGKQTGSDVQS
ncbi:hypothetical protein K438DRAFT_1937031 [Mycena galopus ATCC 62051]|nr:hypothetical protein K438DRAFT_1937031 [Mycena galopus ATCC 62051]